MTTLRTVARLATSIGLVAILTSCGGGGTGTTGSSNATTGSSAAVSSTPAATSSPSPSSAAATQGLADLAKYLTSTIASTPIVLGPDPTPFSPHSLPASNTLGQSLKSAFNLSDTALAVFSVQASALQSGKVGSSDVSLLSTFDNPDAPSGIAADVGGDTSQLDGTIHGGMGFILSQLATLGLDVGGFQETLKGTIYSDEKVNGSFLETANPAAVTLTGFLTPYNGHLVYKTTSKVQTVFRNSVANEIRSGKCFASGQSISANGLTGLHELIHALLSIKGIDKFDTSDDLFVGALSDSILNPKIALEVSRASGSMNTGFLGQYQAGLQQLADKPGAEESLRAMGLPGLGKLVIGVPTKAASGTMMTIKPFMTRQDGAAIVEDIKIVVKYEDGTRSIDYVRTGADGLATLTVPVGPVGKTTVECFGLAQDVTQTVVSAAPVEHVTFNNQSGCNVTTGPVGYVIVITKNGDGPMTLQLNGSTLSGSISGTSFTVSGFIAATNSDFTMTGTLNKDGSGSGSFNETLHSNGDCTFSGTFTLSADASKTSPAGPPHDTTGAP